MSRFHELLLKLLGFAFVYGLIFVNWIDLFNVVLPAYHIWLLFMYFMPFFATVLFYGRRDILLMIALGLMASLMNDMFFYVVGDAFFGFHVPLIPWYMNQLGFNGNQLCFTFQGGFFQFKVVSWMMGLAIYSRIAAITAILWRYWLRSGFRRGQNLNGSVLNQKLVGHHI